MIMKIITIVVMGLLILGVFTFLVFYDNFNKGENMEEEKQPQYQGPVRPTDDEEHFRKTGETKPLEIKE